MPITLVAITEAAILASSLSIDAFTAGFAYGSKRIQMPLLSVQIINLVCSAITGLSLVAGSLLKPYLPNRLILGIAFTILFVTGCIKLMDSVTKSIIKKHKDMNREIKIALFHFNVTLNVQPNPNSLDMDVEASTIIKPMEAALLALSLSLDGMAVGFGAALVNVNGLAVFLCSLITNTTAILTGCHLGHQVARKIPFNTSWLSGVVLIGLAFSKFF